MRLPKRDKRTELEKEIDKLVDELRSTEYNSEDYTKRLDLIERLHKMKEDKTSKRVNINTVITVGVSLLEILLMLNHEKLNVITTKALGFVTRPKL